MEKDSMKISGYIIAEELVPGTDIVVSREEGENIICVGGADELATALGTTVAPSPFNWMAISADAAAVARATPTIPGSLVPTITKFMSTEITPAVDNTPPTSKVTWIFTFAAGAGKVAIAKFGMESSDTGASPCFNEYLFVATKDNLNNDLKLTYTVSIAP